MKNKTNKCLLTNRSESGALYIYWKDLVLPLDGSVGSFHFRWKRWSSLLAGPFLVDWRREKASWNALLSSTVEVKSSLHFRLVCIRQTNLQDIGDSCFGVCGPCIPLGLPGGRAGLRWGRILPSKVSGPDAAIQGKGQLFQYIHKAPLSLLFGSKHLLVIFLINKFNWLHYGLALSLFLPFFFFHCSHTRPHCAYLRKEAPIPEVHTGFKKKTLKRTLKWFF